MASAKLHTSTYKIHNSSDWITVNWNHVEFITYFKIDGEKVGTSIHFNSGNHLNVKDDLIRVERDMKFGKS